LNLQVTGIFILFRIGISNGKDDDDDGGGGEGGGGLFKVLIWL